MPYVFETRYHRDNLLLPTSTTLREMTRAQLARAEMTWDAYKGLNDHDREHRRADWREAHQWVRDGGHHTTTLWVDQGRVRKA